MMAFMKQHFLIIVLSVGLTFDILWHYKMRKRLKLELIGVLIVTFLTMIFGFLSVRLLAEIEGVHGGMRLYGAVFLMPIAYYIQAKITKCQISEVFDIMTVSLVLTLMCARINCFISGCCFGRQISYHTTARWPTREAELLFYLLFLMVAIPKVELRKTDGRLFPIYMVVYGFFRFINEFFRYSETTSSYFHLAHLWSFLAFAIGFSILMEMKKKAGTRNLRLKH